MFRFLKSSFWVKSVRTLGLFLITVSIICLSPREASADPDTLWTKTYGGPYDDFAFSVLQTDDGGFIMAGRSFVEPLNIDMYVVRTDSIGDTLWTRTYGDTLLEGALCMTECVQGGFIMGGWRTDWDTRADAYIVRINDAGDTLWTLEFGGDDTQWAEGIDQTYDGGFIITGKDGEFEPDMYLAKIDGQGNYLWARSYDSEEQDNAFSVEQTTDGGYIIAGYGFGSLVKTDSLGEIEWSQRYFYNGEEGYFHSAHQTTDGGYIAAGAVYQQFGGGYSILLVKTDSMGNENWSQFFGESGDWSEGYWMEQVEDGGYILAGYTGPWDASYVYIVRATQGGELLWDRIYELPSSATFSAKETKVDGQVDGGFIAAGTSYGSMTAFDFVLLRIAELESIVDEDSSLQPDTFGIHGIYPNPFNSSTKISYSLESIGNARLAIFNIAGQRVLETNIMHQGPGRYAIQWDASGLSSGVYVVKLTQGENTDSKRMLLLK